MGTVLRGQAERWGRSATEQRGYGDWLASLQTEADGRHALYAAQHVAHPISLATPRVEQEMIIRHHCLMIHLFSSGGVQSVCALIDKQMMCASNCPR
jgi:hypothetical protein